MRCLTLTQPYATLIAIGAKHIETRSWHTSFRGPLAIHAAAGLGPVGGRAGLYDLAFSDPDGLFYPALHRAHMFCIDDLPLGAIVATCELVDCVETMPSWAAIEPWLVVSWTDGRTYHVPPGKGSHERAFGDYTPGRYAWLLGNIKALPEPILCKGALGLWQPDTLTEMAIKRQQIRAIGA